jgi:hypothetical protein
MPTLAPTHLRGVQPARLPQHHGVQLPTLVECAPEGDHWLHEIKID